MNREKINIAMIEAAVKLISDIDKTEKELKTAQLIKLLDKTNNTILMQKVKDFGLPKIVYCSTDIDSKVKTSLSYFSTIHTTPHLKNGSIMFSFTERFDPFKNPDFNLYNNSKI